MANFDLSVLLMLDSSFFKDTLVQIHVLWLFQVQWTKNNQVRMAETYGHQPGYAKSFEAVFGKVAHSPETGLIVLIFRDHEFLLYDPVKNAGLSKKRGNIRYVSVEKTNMDTLIISSRYSSGYVITQFSDKTILIGYLVIDGEKAVTYQQKACKPFF